MASLKIGNIYNSLCNNYLYIFWYKYSIMKYDSDKIFFILYKLEQVFVLYK